MKKILVTGCAGFIGYHLCKRLLLKKHDLLGVDNLSNYYDISLKKSRLNEIKKITEKYNLKWKFNKLDLINKNDVDNLFNQFKPEIVIHLAAQAGVRFSINHPEEYINSNLIGFFNVIENCRNHFIKNFLFASSSSVYGDSSKVPFSESNNVDCPVSLYGATKKSNELIAYSYSHLYKLPSIGMRFFTVYGPWGRPDMAPMLFTKAILSGSSLKVFNNGQNKRDFTYIDDIIEAIDRLIEKGIKSNQTEFSKQEVPYQIFNIGNNKPINILKFIETLEEEIGIKAKKDFIPMQLGDVKETFADTNKIEKFLGFKPNTDLNNGIKLFIKWYKSFYKDI